MTLLPLKRIPQTANHTLCAHNAADELLVKTVIPQLDSDKKIAVVHDRFGYLSCHLMPWNPKIYVHLKSQQEAIQSNWLAQGFSQEIQWTDFFAEPSQEVYDVVVIHLPKSIELLEWYMQILLPHCHEKTLMYWGFMTRHFTPSWLSLGEKYFHIVQQGKAEKKARLLQLTQPKTGLQSKVGIREIEFNKRKYQQFPGIFSTGKIDMATKFLLDHLTLRPDEKNVLDWGCGMGIIGGFLVEKYPDIHLDCIDDFLPAIASARMNLPEANCFWNYKIPVDVPNPYDLIITNPPFHFEYETDITISIQFFKECYPRLAPKGRLVIVANKHLNYKTHLDKIFPAVYSIYENQKFIVYDCRKISRE